MKKHQTLEKQFDDAVCALANLSGALSAIRYVSDAITEHKDFPCIIAILDEYAEKAYSEIFDNLETTSLSIGGDVA